MRIKAALLATDPDHPDAAVYRNKPSMGLIDNYERSFLTLAFKNRTLEYVPRRTILSESVTCMMVNLNRGHKFEAGGLKPQCLAAGSCANL